VRGCAEACLAAAKPQRTDTSAVKVVGFLDENDTITFPPWSTDILANGFEVLVIADN